MKMTDKKFTDEEIIKALECCSADKGDCDKCVLQKECKNTPFYTAAAKAALNLINRQKAEIDKLQTIIFKKEDTLQMIAEERQQLAVERGNTP